MKKRKKRLVKTKENAAKAWSKIKGPFQFLGYAISEHPYYSLAVLVIILTFILLYLLAVDPQVTIDKKL